MSRSCNAAIRTVPVLLPVYGSTIKSSPPHRAYVRLSQFPKMIDVQIPEDVPLVKFDGICSVESARYPFTVPSPALSDSPMKTGNVVPTLGVIFMIARPPLLVTYPSLPNSALLTATDFSRLTRFAHVGNVPFVPRGIVGVFVSFMIP